MDAFIICLGVVDLFNVLDSAEAPVKWVGVFPLPPFIFK